MQHDNFSQSAAHTILTTCAGAKKEDRILIASDSHDRRVRYLSSVGEELGALVSIEQIDGEITREPTKELAKKMLDNEIIIFCVNEKRTLLWGHADARVAAVRNGGRVLFLTQDLDDTPAPGELERISARSQRLGDILETVSDVSVVTGAASQLEVKLAKRKSLRLSSLLSKPGSWGAVPDYAEAAVPPMETGSNGSLQVDGTIVGIGKVDSPVELKFENGRLRGISGGRVAKEFERLLSEYDDSARILCELGFGTNHLRSEIRGEFDDKKALGSLHIGLGDNHTFGGENRSSLHIDCLVSHPEVRFDGRIFDLMSL
ncbi:MAG: hypothetical protein JRN20_19140 [Nitrososphaerota archaeon]|nr:hypothetical protein [Nitrososphaerota archaeon]